MNFLYKNKSLCVSLISVILCALLFCSCSCDDQISQTEKTTPPQNKKEVVSSYSYANLPDERTKELYAKIDEYAHKVAEETFVLKGEYSETEMFESLEAYKNDHPEVFWLESTYDYYYENGDTHLKIMFIIENDELITAKKTFDEEVKKILDNAPKNASDYELELYFNDYIIDNCTYNKKAAKINVRIGNEGNAYGALVDKKAVCEGYSRAFQLLCNKVNIDCVSILGETEGTPHQWNCIKLDDNWYHVDVTWNDPDQEDGWLRYDYLNVSDEQISDNHTVRELYSEAEIDPDAEFATLYNLFVPKCTSTEYNYYNTSCVKLTDVENSDELIDKLAESANNKEEFFSFVIDESLDYTQTAETIINEGYLYGWVEDANEKNDDVELNPGCPVYQNKKHNVITVKLEYV